jgi:predicted negative regulator of RcsB-dependent stress response
LDHLLAQEERPNVKAKAHLLKGRAYLALGKLEEATTSAESGLDIDKETLLSAQLGSLMGDIAMTANRTVEAISSFGRVKNTWEDPTLTPLAMFKLAGAYEKSGDPGDLRKAEDVKKDLAKRFPRFQAPPAKAP